MSAPGSCPPRATSKKVDFALALDIAEDTPLWDAIQALQDVDACNGRHSHVNQTAYKPLVHSPIAVSIETKANASQRESLPVRRAGQSGRHEGRDGGAAYSPFSAGKHVCTCIYFRTPDASPSAGAPRIRCLRFKRATFGPGPVTRHSKMHPPFVANHLDKGQGEQAGQGSLWRQTTRPVDGGAVGVHARLPGRYPDEDGRGPGRRDVAVERASGDRCSMVVSFHGGQCMASSPLATGTSVCMPLDDISRDAPFVVARRLLRNILLRGTGGLRYVGGLIAPHT